VKIAGTGNCPFLFLFAGLEVRLPSRRRALLAWHARNVACIELLRLERGERLHHAIIAGGSRSLLQAT
jgi:hypothetical protein